MALQTGMVAAEAYAAIKSGAISWKGMAQNTIVTLQSGPVNSDFVFAVLNQLGNLINSFNTWKAVVGLDAWATSVGYTGTMSADCTSCTTAAQACINWVVTNFPASSGFLQSHTLNADGSRTPRSFSTANTAGLVTLLQALVATIG